MHRNSLAVLLLLSCGPAMAQSGLVAADGAIRAAFIASNPAQAVRDPQTGEWRGVAVDLANELGRQVGARVTLVGQVNAQGVIDAVRDGEAEIGFVAYNPERAGPVEFSQPYLLVQQTFLAREGSSIRGVADVDRAGIRLGARRADSIALYLKRTLKNAQLIELTDNSPDTVLRYLRDDVIDAFGANRQRLADMAKGAAGVRLLADDLYGVEQTIIVPAGRRDALMRVNEFVADVRRSGFLRASIERSGVIGIAVAPDGPGAQGAVTAADQVDVVSIRPSTFPNAEYFAGYLAGAGDCGASAPRIRGERVVFERATLCGLIRFARDLKDYQIVDRPGWMEKPEPSIFYDIQITAANGRTPSRDDAKGMVNTAVQEQLGLKLDPQRLPLAVIVIDRAEQPSPN